ncbi:hypothetical protein [Candidatus Poriferisocius sp.]|uniref:hypothetical protein n=1 Tax=Candidatus Poriferisocius sp. TaxID=3101276 RepID=UPI003B01C694
MGPFRVPAAVALLVTAALSPGYGTADDGYPDRDGLIQMVEDRDELIRQQEDLLNSYRCLFDVDTHIVPGGCAPEPTPAVFPNDHVLDGWEAAFVTCHWAPIGTGRATTWHLVMLATVAADEPRPWERWHGLDVEWSARGDGHEVSEGPIPLSLGRSDFPNGGRTLELYYELPVYGHYESESIADEYSAHESGGEVPLVWYLLDGGERIPIDEPDLDAEWECGLVYDSLLTYEQWGARSTFINVCVNNDGRDSDECLAEARSDSGSLDWSRWDYSNICGYQRC